MKADFKETVFFSVFLTVCLLLFNSCGLEEYVYLVGPTTLNHTSYYTTVSEERYVEFTTAETANSTKPQFQGTAVYYKIYNNHGTLSSQVSAINSLSTSTNESAAADKMIDTYGYKQLGLNENYNSPLIPNTGENKKVYIRLSNYYEDVSYQNRAIVIIGSENVNKFHADSENVYDAALNPSGYRIQGLPRRAGNSRTFDFGRAKPSFEGAEFNVPPDGDDGIGDYVKSGSTSENYENCYFVALFAVGVGEDENFNPYRSNVLHLGSFTIDTSLENN